jgi:methylthioribose-1-phosphate isomerase
MARLGGRAVVPDGVPVRHPAFDVTPAGYITAIVTEAGIARPDYSQALRDLVTRQR